MGKEVHGSISSFLTSLTCLFESLSVYITFEVTVLRTGPEIGGKGVTRWERKGFMVAVGWAGQDFGDSEYEVVRHLPGY